MDLDLHWSLGFDHHLGLLSILGAVTWLLTPILLLYHYFYLLPKRGKEIEAVFESKAGAISAYQQLFPPYEEIRSKENTIILHRFLGLHHGRAYLVPGFLLQVTTGIAIAVTVIWIESKIHRSGSYAERIPIEILLAYAGTYLWSIYELLNRISSKDLLPENLYELTLRFIGAPAIGYASSLLVMDRVGGLMAFAACAFPLRDFKLVLRQYLIRKAGQNLDAGRARALEGHLATTVEGLSDQKLARLAELNIVTYMDMAYVDPVKLMAKTGFSLRDILASIDQALLVVYGHDREPFDKVGIPCALDACEVFERHCKSDDGSEKLKPPDPYIVALAKELKIAPVFVPEMLQEIYKDPHVQFIRILWRDDKVVDFSTKRLTPERLAPGPDGFNRRTRLGLNLGSLLHFEVPPGQSSVPVVNRAGEEIWLFLGGRGELWRKRGDREEVIPIEAGISVTIPTGTHFQVRSSGEEPLTVIGAAMPPWLEKGGSTAVPGKWETTMLNE